MLQRLRAFARAGDAPLPGLPFRSLEQEARAAVGRLDLAIMDALDGEVDAGQARMFARRHRDVATLLESLSPGSPAARVLRVGLWRRLVDVLAAPPPRALRVRAVVDFYYSMAAVTRHAADGGPCLAERVATLAWGPVAPGVRHACMGGRTDEGPLLVNILEVAPGCRVQARDTRGVPDLASFVTEQGACAATSGGFFLYSEPEIRPPSARHDLVGLLVEAGQVRSPATLGRTCLVQGTDGRFRIERIGPDAFRLGVPDGRTLLVTGRNTAPHDGPGLQATAWDRAHGRRAPALAGPWLEVVGTHARWHPPGEADIPLNGLLLALPPDTQPLGGEVRWQAPAAIATAMAGGPRLLRDGALDLERLADDFAGDAPPVTFSQDETWDQNRLPRLAAGLREDGTLVLVAIDGRNMERAPGFTLAGTAVLLRHLGCVDAMNLDGGSSKRMIVDGRTVDLSTTEVVADLSAPARVRPVHSALLVFPRGTTPD